MPRGRRSGRERGAKNVRGGPRRAPHRAPHRGLTANVLPGDGPPAVSSPSPGSQSARADVGRWPGGRCSTTTASACPSSRPSSACLGGSCGPLAGGPGEGARGDPRAHARLGGSCAGSRPRGRACGSRREIEPRWPRSRGDGGVMWYRALDVAEVWPRCGRDVAEVCGRGVAEVWPRCSRDVAEM